MIKKLNVVKSLLDLTVTHDQNQARRRLRKKQMHNFQLILQKQKASESIDSEAFYFYLTNQDYLIVNFSTTIPSIVATFTK